MIGGILSVQFGAAIAKDLFAVVPPTAMVWLRLATSAVIFMIIARPAIRGRSRSDWLVALSFGIALATMNWAIYQSFARIPLGMAVTIEFLGPLTVALIGSRHVRDLIWVALAGLGVAMLGFSPSGLNLAGVLFALLAGAGWAAYILLSAQTGRRWPGVTGLAVASLVGVVTLAPPAIVEAGGDVAAAAGADSGGCGRTVVVGHPVQPGAHRAAPHPAAAVRHLDESGAGGGGLGGHPAPERVPDRAAVAGHGLRGRRLDRRHPQLLLTPGRTPAQ